MNNQIKSSNVLKQTELLGQQFIVYGTKEEPLFVAADVAAMIEHPNTSELVKLVDDDEKLTSTILRSGQNRQVWMLTENGLYEVLMQSRKPIAKQFKKGVKAILKEIRQTGGYLSTSQDDTPELIMARALQVAQATIESHKQRVQMLEGTVDVQKARIEVLAPKAQYTDDVLQSSSTYTFTQMAKELNYSSVNAFINRLREEKIIFKQSGQWQLTAKYAGKGYSKTRTARFFHRDGTPDTSVSTVWTDLGRVFLHRKLSRIINQEVFPN